MDLSRSHILIQVINNCPGPGLPDNKIQIVTLFCFDLLYIKFLINAREKKELPGVELWTSASHGLLAFGCPTEP